MLKIPHVDKRRMEDLYRGQMDNGVFKSVTGMRPTLLMGTADVTDCAGLGKVRAGTESEPQTGYWIKRSDVGEWIFVNWIQEQDGRWEGEMVSLTS